MLQMKIEDAEFAHSISSCGLTPKHFSWYRGPESRATCFFTDTRLDQVLTSQSQRKIGWLLESSVINRKSYRFMREHHERFDYVLTHDRSLVDDRKFLFVPFGGCWIQRPPDALEWPTLPSKTHNLSIIASGKKYTKGQKLRHRIIRWFGRHLELYGRGYRPIEFKNEALEPFRFSVVVENGMSDDYFTEKIVDCCTLGTVPVYWGTRNIGRYFDGAGILRFENTWQFWRLLPRLTEETYVQMLPAVRNNLRLSQKYRLAEDWIFEHYPFLFENP